MALQTWTRVLPLQLPPGQGTNIQQGGCQQSHIKAGAAPAKGAVFHQCWLCYQHLVSRSSAFTSPHFSPLPETYVNTLGGTYRFTLCFPRAPCNAWSMTHSASKAPSHPAALARQESRAWQPILCSADMFTHPWTPGRAQLSQLLQLWPPAWGHMYFPA